MTYYNSGTVGKSRLVNTTTWLGRGTTISTGTRVYSPHSSAIGAGLVDAASIVEDSETTVVTRQGALAGVALAGGVGLALLSNGE